MAFEINDKSEIAVNSGQSVFTQNTGGPGALTGRWTIASLLTWLKGTGDLITTAEADAAYAAIGHVGSGGAAHADAVASGADGFMTGADKAKLDGVAASANNYSHPNHTGDVTSVGDGAQTIAALAVTAAKLAANSVETAKILDDNVTLAKLAHGTAGGLVHYNGTGVPAELNPGTSGHVLTSNGAGSAPTYQAAAGTGDMLASVYDPDTISGDAFLQSNMKDEHSANNTGGVTAGDVCYYTSSGTWIKAQANALATTKGLLGIAKTTETTGNPVVCILTGHYTTTGLSAGSVYYLDPSVAGGWTTTLPTGANYTRILGYALSTTVLRFNPSDDYILGT